MLLISSFKNIKKHHLIFVLFLIVSFFCTNAHAQLSRKHYLPPLHSASESSVNNQYLYLSTFEISPFTVTITDGAGIPIAGSPFVISKGNHVRVLVGSELSDSKLFVTGDELNKPITSKGLLLEAKKMFYASLRTDYVSGVRALHGGYLTCKGESALGNSFRLGSIPHGGNLGPRNFFSSIMATEDNTSISISDYNTEVEFYDENGNITSDRIDVTLNKGESYVISGNTDIVANLDGFIGALVTSDKPVAVNTGNYNGGFSTQSSTDFGIDQIVPISDIGKEYIAIRGNGSDLLEQLILVAANDNTDVYVNGSTVPYNAAPLNAGDYLLIEGDQYQGSSNQNIYLTTSEPSYLYQSIGGSTDNRTTGFNFIPPITCFFLKQIDEIPDVKRIGDTDYNGNIAIVTTIGSEVSVNGVKTEAVAEAVLGNTEWETYRINNLDGDITVASTGPLSVAFYGTSAAAGFSGYYSSFGLSPNGNTDVYLCSDEPVDLLTYVDGFPDSGGTWSPELTSGTSIFNPSMDNEGVYNYVLNTSCTTIDVTITVAMRAAPIMKPDLIYSLCDDDNDGFSNFDLEFYAATILNGQTDISVTFHETELEAQDLKNQLSSPYINDDTIIYARLQDDLSDCITIGTFDLAIGNSQSEDVSYTLCDSGNGTANFDLESQIEKISGVASGIPVSFYLTETNAEGSLSPIDTSTVYNSPGILLYTRVENSGSCYSIGTLELIIGTGPIIAEDLVYELCDDNLDGDATNGLVDFDLESQVDAILDGQTGVIVTFYELEADAESGLNPLLSPYNSGSKTLYTRLEQDIDCYGIGELELLVNPAPLIVPDLIYALCDDDNDGLVEFDLDSQTDAVLNGQVGITVSFHATVNEAENSLNALPNMFTSGNETLYTRLENELTNCYSIGELALNIDGGVEVITDLTYELCDVDGDGFVGFDLASQIDRISNGVTDLIVSFYLTEANAEAAITSIDTSILYTSSGEVLFTRVENTTSCYSTGTIELSIGNGPRVTENLIYALCDDTIDGDATNGLVDFDLESQVDVILDGQTGIAVTFYELETDAEDGLNPLLSPYNSGNKTLYTRLEQEADCYSIGELELQVNPLPAVVSGLSYILCDDDSDGIVDFDLDSQTEAVLNGQVGITVTFHETETDAENSVNSLSSIYNSSNEILYTRLENELTGCFNVSELELLVNPSPGIESGLTYELCDVDGDGSVGFDLASQIDRISNAVTDVTVTFYLSEANAEAATAPIDTSNLYASPGRILFTRVENTTSCYSIGTLELNIGDGPRVTENLVYALCDDAIDGDATNGLVDFDLESQVESILAGQSVIAVTFYELEVDAENGLNPLLSPYNSGNKTLYTRLEQEADCYSIGELALKVNPIPEVAIGLTYSLCNNEQGDLVEFDLLSQIITVLNGQTDIEVTFHEFENDAENGVNILNSITTSDSKTIYTRLENENTGCISYGSIELLVENVPQINLAEIYYICEGDTETPLIIDAAPTNIGEYSYEWNPKNPDVNFNGGESAIYAITEGGNYSVTIIDESSTQFCETIENLEVIELTRPVIINVLGTAELFINQSSSTIEVITSDNQEFYEYSLDNGLWQTSAVFDNVGGGKHEVFVRDVNGCNFEDSREFEFILFKPFFTPNGDNTNDYWKIDGLSDEYEALIYIYDRFGKLLKQINPNDIGWDGIFNGKNMPSDDYWVLIEYTNDGVRQNYQSHFSLIR